MYGLRRFSPGGVHEADKVAPNGEPRRLTSADFFWRRAGLAAGLWVLTEYLRGTLFTGFPWLALGYAQTPPSPLAGYAAVLGVYGVGGLVALVAALLAFANTRHRRLVAAAAIVGLLAGGALLRAMDWTQPSGAPFSVSLLQGNIPQSLKWDPERLPLSVETYARLTRDHPADLTVLPETAIPLFFDQVPAELWQALTRHGNALVGIAIRLQDGGYVNGAVALRPSVPANPITAGSIDKAAPAVAVPPAPTFTGTQSYAKRHLVPFGEYVPPGFAWFFDLVRIPMSDFTAGPAVQPALQIGAAHVAVNICYEDLFGAEIRQALPEATLLINLSNTAWFGDSLAQPQHLQIARLRALETGRMMLRATNTGMTAAIAPDGRVLGALPPFTAGALRIEAQGFTGITPYLRWGDALALVLAIGACLPLFMEVWRRRRSR
jgi:apolipoprotein N-acyltransferase